MKNIFYSINLNKNKCSKFMVSVTREAASLAGFSIQKKIWIFIKNA
jgi:hypothetical protein